MSRSILKVRGIDKLTSEELHAFLACADALAIDPDWLACVVSFETGGSFSPAQRNHWAAKDAEKRGVPYSGAMGLIQFMPATAKALGTSTAGLEAMSFVRQLEYVRRYLATYAARIHSLEDCYLAVFYPAAMGRADDYVVGARGAEGFLGRVYEQNAGFDKAGNNDNRVTRGEICATIRAVRDAAAGARLDLGGTTSADEPTVLFDLTEVARDADDAALRDTLAPVTKKNV
jgi:hypothetical protein